MHSGFMALRNECGMNLHRPIRAVPLVGRRPGQCGADRGDLGRLPCALWQAGTIPVRRVLGADAMYAPVVHRLRTYAIPVKAEAQRYVDAMMALPAFQEWTRDGLAETLLIDRLEQV